MHALRESRWRGACTINLYQQSQSLTTTLVMRSEKDEKLRIVTSECLKPAKGSLGALHDIIGNQGQYSAKRLHSSDAPAFLHIHTLAERQDRMLLEAHKCAAHLEERTFNLGLALLQ